MTEQAGHLNAPDLVEECVSALYLSHATGEHEVPDMCLGEIIDCQPNLTLRILRGGVNDVLSVLRKRGLLTIQALEMLADK